MTFFHRHRWLTPYLLLLPGLAWLAVFFAVPTFYLGNTSLQEGSLELGYRFQWAWGNYADAVSLYHDQFLRSLEYAGLATYTAYLQARRDVLYAEFVRYWRRLERGAFADRIEAKLD